MHSLRSLSEQNSACVVLNSPSIDLIKTAISGAASAVHTLDPQVYVIHPSMVVLRDFWRELVSAGIEETCLLYAGDLEGFFRDAAITPSLLFLGDARFTPQLLRANLAPGVPVLTNGTIHVLKSCLDLGVLQASNNSPYEYRATSSCMAQPATISTDAFRAARGLLHGLYFSQSNDDVRSVSAATRPLRQSWTQGADAPVSGYAEWPYRNPDPVKLPATLPSGAPWPKISVVTASYNQGCYIEQTILSVLNQDYPNVEHIVMDGGSTDETLSILERYRDRLACVVSERDRGQSHAINKGMQRATGDILTWLNSDDMLAPGSLAAVAMAFDTSGADMVAGICRLYGKGKLVEQHLTACADGMLPLNDILDVEGGWNAGQFFYQPEVMFQRSLWEKAGAHVDESCFWSMDYELWMRFAELGARIHPIGRPVAWFRLHEQQKTSAVEAFKVELVRVRDAYLARTGRSFTPRNMPSQPRRRLRIAMLNDHGFQYGAGIAHQRLAEALAAAGHQVIPLTLGEFSEDKRPLQNSLAGDVVDRIAAHEPDLVLAGNIHSVSPDPGLLLLLAERLPTLCVLHDFWLLTGRCAYPGDCSGYLQGCDHNCPTANEYPALEPAAIAPAWKTKRALLNSALPMLLANSQWTSDYFRKALAGTPAAQIPRIGTFQLSFPLDTFRPLDKRMCRRVLGLPEDKFVLLITCEFADRRKGASRVLDALLELQLANLVVASSSWSDPDPKYGGLDMHRLGYINDPDKLAMAFSAADLLVGPSHEETFGQVFVEAAACGTPSIGFPTSGVQEAIRDGVTGRLAAGTDVSSLAAAILELYRNPSLREDMSRWGRIYVENEWSPFSAYRKFFLALESLGLLDRLGMPHKISFLAEPPALPECRSVTRTTEVRGQGLCDPEGPDEKFNLPVFRWALGPRTTVEIQAQHKGPHLVAFHYRNFHSGQSVEVETNGRRIGKFQLANAGLEMGRVLCFRADLEKGRNTVELHFAAWSPPEQNERPLAAAITNIVCFRA